MSIPKVISENWFQLSDGTKLYHESGTFATNGKEYNLNAILWMTRNTPVTSIPMSELSWICAETDVDTIDDIRVEYANTDVPIIVHHEEGIGWVIVDGFHRFFKMYHEALEAGTLPETTCSVKVLDRYPTVKQCVIAEGTELIMTSPVLSPTTIDNYVRQSLNSF